MTSRSAIAQALPHGGSMFEVLETCLVPGGPRRLHRGLSALMEVKD